MLALINDHVAGLCIFILALLLWGVSLLFTKQLARLRTPIIPTPRSQSQRWLHPVRGTETERKDFSIYLEIDAGPGHSCRAQELAWF